MIETLTTTTTTTKKNEQEYDCVCVREILKL